MRRSTVAVVILLVMLAFAALVSVIVGRQHPPAVWLRLLQLNECELPCWNGIELGRTTLVEAQEQVEDAYADTSLYSIETQEHFQFRVTYEPTGYRVGIVLRSDDESPQSVVRTIYLLPSLVSSSTRQYPIIPELYSALGDAVAVRLASGAVAPSVTLFFKDQRVNVFVEQLKCNKVLLDQEITSIVLHDQIRTEGAWISEPQPWRGFGQCHDLEPPPS